LHDVTDKCSDLRRVDGLGVYTVGLFPALDRLAAVELNEPAIASEHAARTAAPTNGRPRLNICFRLGNWTEDPECSAFGGYDENWSELCSQKAVCRERVMLQQQTCVDRPRACYRFLLEPGGEVTAANGRAIVDVGP
jgi:hypothetical protein